MQCMGIFRESVSYLLPHEKVSNDVRNKKYRLAYHPFYIHAIKLWIILTMLLHFIAYVEVAHQLGCSSSPRLVTLVWSERRNVLSTQTHHSLLPINICDPFLEASNVTNSRVTTSKIIPPRSIIHMFIRSIFLRLRSFPYYCRIFAFTVRLMMPQHCTCRRRKIQLTDPAPEGTFSYFVQLFFFFWRQSLFSLK